jgi:hypothetical protein
VQSGDEGQERVAAVADLERLDGGIPAALLLVESAEEKIGVCVKHLIGMGLGLLTVGALALVNVSDRHGQTPSFLTGDGVSIEKAWKLFVNGSKVSGLRSSAFSQAALADLLTPFQRPALRKT